jgi:hypothetical protein
LRTRFIVLIGLSASIVALVGLTWVYPSVDDLFVGNPFWNGLSEMYVAVQPVRVGNLTELSGVVVDDSNSTLLFLGPSRGFESSEVGIVRSYLAGGGTVVLADDFGTGNELLEGLGLNVRFSGQLMQDPLFKDRAALMPVLFNFTVPIRAMNVSSIELNYPTVLTGTGGVKVLAWSTYFSYLSDDVSAPKLTSTYGPFPIIASVKVGAGTLILISDSSVFINGMYGLGDNAALLNGLVRGIVVIDESHSIPSTLTIIQGMLATVYAFLSQTEIKYGLVALCVVAGFKVKWDEPPVVREDEVEATLRRHPEWDRALVEEVDRLRKKNVAG